MIDIVERIRQNQCPDIMNCNVNPYCSCADLEDAADTIDQLLAELAALREGGEPVAWIVEHDDLHICVELHNQFDHTPEVRKKEEAMGWRFTPLYKAALSATQQENNNGN